MANQMTGKIILIGPTQTLTSKKGTTFTKREIVLDCTRFDPYTGERGYENFPVFEFGGNNCSMLDGYQPGQVVTIDFDIQGTKGSQGDRYFNTVRGYRIALRQQGVQQPVQPVQTAQPQPYMGGMATPPPAQGYQYPQGYAQQPIPNQVPQSDEPPF